MLCGCCVTIQIKWWRWRCVCMPQCRRCIHCSCIRLHWLNAYFLIPFCVVVRRTLCAASLKRVTVYHMEIVGNEILLYEFSLCELFSEDRIKLVNRGTPPPNGSTALVGLGVLVVEVSGSHSDTLPTLRHPWTSDRPFAEKEGLLYSQFVLELRARTHGML